MKKFKQAVTMEVTQKQYENDLKIPLEKLGYNCDKCINFNKYPILYANYSSYFDNEMASGLKSNIDYNNGSFLDSYNPELFLALAAITEGDEWVKGEYLIELEATGKSGFIFKVKELSGCNGDMGYASNRYFNKYYRKATKEELIKHFSNNKVNPLTPTESYKNEDFVLPKRWCIKVTEENIKTVNDWKIKGKSTWGSPRKALIGSFVAYDRLYNGCIGEYETEITFDQFKKHVLKEFKSEPIMENKNIDYVGKWIITTMGSLYFVENINGNSVKAYGIDFKQNRWHDSGNLCSISQISHIATEEEINSIFIRYINKQYPKGTEYIPLWRGGGEGGGWFGVCINLPKKNDIGWYCGYGYLYLFKDNKWAEIVKEDKVVEKESKPKPLTIESDVAEPTHIYCANQDEWDKVCKLLNRTSFTKFCVCGDSIKINNPGQSNFKKDLKKGQTISYSNYLLSLPGKSHIEIDFSDILQKPSIKKVESNQVKLNKQIPVKSWGLIN